MSIMQFSKSCGHIGALAGAVVGCAASVTLVPIECAIKVPLGKVRDGFFDDHLVNGTFVNNSLPQKISLLTDHMSHYIFKPSDERFEIFWKCTAQSAPIVTAYWSLQIASFGAVIGAILGYGRGLYNRALHET